jgi:hypothetical protein
MSNARNPVGLSIPVQPERQAIIDATQRAHEITAVTGHMPSKDVVR